MRTIGYAVALLALCSTTALAAKPSASQASAKATAKHAAHDKGSTIVGSQESPIGLYITPWKNDYATPKMAAPHNRLEVYPEPIDPDTFHRQVQYYHAISSFRAAQLAHGKDSPPPPQNK